MEIEGEVFAYSYTDLPNDIWIRSFSFLDTHDTVTAGCACRMFLSTSSSDLLWEIHCRQRWNGKQNVKRFVCKRRERRRMNGENDNYADDGRVEYCRLLLSNFQPRFMPPLNMSSLLRMHDPVSWKESYIMAEIDSRRIQMTEEELVYFRWKLMYDGNPSQLGLRKFNKDGTYWSPYMGVCEWVLHNELLSFAGMNLAVERDPRNWGWIIGRGQRTEYCSVEEEGF